MVGHDDGGVEVVPFAIVVQAVTEDGVPGFWSKSDSVAFAKCYEYSRDDFARVRFDKWHNSTNLHHCGACRTKSHGARAWMLKTVYVFNSDHIDYHYRVMPAQADIIVRSPDSTRVSLVVEAKLRVSNLEHTERQLKNFMLQLRCPVGVLISPDRLWVYLDRFTSDSEESVDRLGEFLISDLISFHPVPAMAGETAAASAFENAVQSWLESLPSSDTRQLVKDVNLRSAIDHYIVPAVENGIVEAAGPR